MKFSDAIKLMEEGKICCANTSRYKISDNQLLIQDSLIWRKTCAYIGELFKLDWQLYEKPQFTFEQAMKKIISGTIMTRQSMSSPCYRVTLNEHCVFMRDGHAMMLTLADIQDTWEEV